MSNLFRTIFDKNDDPKRERAKFLSKMFGIFSEKVVSIWANDSRAIFENIGRPTLKFLGEPSGHTLDFAFRDRSNGKIYVAEMKCEIELENFKYFVLKSSSQIDHHRKPAFDAFLKSARAPKAVTVSVKRQKIEINGAILVWGAVDPDGKRQVMLEKGFHDILSVEMIRSDLVCWQNQEYLQMIDNYREWSKRLFDGLISRDACK